MIIFDAEVCRKELVGRTVGAITASSGGIRVGEVATRDVDERLQVLRACGAARRVHLDELNGSAVDRFPANDCSLVVSFGANIRQTGLTYQNQEDLR